ncbi:hypothetical protein QE152_g40204 [Popillia japonica]|uniref:Conserved oligomeric Golgi complex subunit 1 n=1 Tax=Popillia japonica TaxID=7064 RepID=A0AAW1HS49_POPJA
MAKTNYNLLNLEINKLFEERYISEIIELEKIIDAEIEKKRLELRCMVGDRYKDILAASDAINTMKDISQQIVEYIGQIKENCETLVKDVDTNSMKTVSTMNAQKMEERCLVAQIRLTIFMNEQIWLALDEQDYSKAAQFYLLAQHVHTGLRLLRKDILDKVPLLKQIKNSLEILRERILNRVKEKLESLETTVEVSSSNLNSLMLLESQTSSELLCTFINLRKTALIKVIQKLHSSVRHQLSAMVKCLITTVHLLHDCFISYQDSSTGLIWQQLEDIVNENAPSTLSKIELPERPLLNYVPEIISQFRPKCSFTTSKEWKEDLENCVKEWLHFTTDTIDKALEERLELITSIKGLYIIREEALKTNIPDDWITICTQAYLPSDYNVWYYFFQKLITKRALHLISKKVKSNIESLQSELVRLLEEVDTSNESEKDLRWYTWHEDTDDVSKMENVHTGLSMKTKGYSNNIIKLCNRADVKYLDILNDMSYYLYGKEYDSSQSMSKFSQAMHKRDRKYSDHEKLQTHLTTECIKSSKCFIEFLQQNVHQNDGNDIILKSLLCARSLQAITVLCPNFKKCCSSSGSDDWKKVRNFLTTASLEFWRLWVDDVVTQIAECSSQAFTGVDIVQMLQMYHKWDSIEIQEQTDEKVFKSQIRVPFQLSSSLLEVLTHLSMCLSYVLPHTLPKTVHMQLLERSVDVILSQYEKLLSTTLNQKQALQFLFDVKFVMLFCVPRENMKLVQKCQEICDKLRTNIDPFDLDVFYSYLQNNVKQSALQSAVILGCLLPNSSQLANLGMLEKNKEQEKEPSILPLSVPSTSMWFPLLPVTAPVSKTSLQVNKNQKDFKNVSPKIKPTKKATDAASSVRSGAAALFGAMTTDWFSKQ